MNESWKRLDLAGGGVQALNLLLARQLKKRRTAYSLLALLPLGLHRFYLASPVAGALYILASLAAAALTWWGLGPAAAVVALAVVVAGVRDIRWVDDRVAALNKRRRLQAYLGQGAAPPPGYAGRHSATEADEAGQTRDGAAAGRYPSFAEQERLLKELARHRQDRR
ncbi:MAG: hypothetical protein AB1768_13895 [Pseudomonadota bacterium]|jgi:TM2 domain-containing membrane protein YozV